MRLRPVTRGEGVYFILEKGMFCMFGRKKRPGKVPKTFDHALLEPCVRSSICTGEKSVGFRNRETGKFEEYAALRSDADLAAFLEEYGLTKDELRTIY